MDTSRKSDPSSKHSPSSAHRDLGDLMGLPPSPSQDGPPQEDFSEPAVSPFASEDSFPRKIVSGKTHHLWMFNPESYPRVLETFREFKNSIISLNETKKFKSFLISGAEMKVGASTVAFNLALVLSRDLPEKRILFVDANVISPFLNTIFEYSQEPCLMDYLLRKVSLNAIILPSFLQNLNLVFSCKIKSHKLSPFNIEIFDEFLDRVRQHYDFIILDSAPALISSHTRSISTKTDGVILVAEANRTRREVISEFRRRLKEDNAHFLGSFLNKRRFVIPKWLYRFI